MISLIRDAHAGKARLWLVFWVFSAFVHFAGGVALTAFPLPRDALYVAVLLSSAYFFWVAYVLWRCAPNATFALSTLAGRVWSIYTGAQAFTAVLMVLNPPHA